MLAQKETWMKSEVVILYIFHLEESIIKLSLDVTHAEIESSAAAFLCVISGLLLPYFVSEVKSSSADFLYICSWIREVLQQPE